MGLPSSRFMLFHRLVLLPPLVLLTLTCLYTSSTLSPFSSTHHLSFAQDVQCFSCDSSSSFQSRSFLSLANFPASSYIRDIVLRHNVLNVEDSTSETSTEPVSRPDTNQVETFVSNGRHNNEIDGPDDTIDGAHRDTTKRVNEDVSLPDEETWSARNVVPLEKSVAYEKPFQQEKPEEEEVPAEVEKSTHRPPWGEKSGSEHNVDKPVYGNNDAPTQKNTDNSVPSAENKVTDFIPSDRTAPTSIPEDQKFDSFNQIEEFSSEKIGNWEDRWKKDGDSSVPEGKNADSSVQAKKFFSSEPKANSEEHGDSSVPEGTNVDSAGQVEKIASETADDAASNSWQSSSETKEYFEGDRKEDLQLENRHLTSDDHASPGDEHETNVGFPAGPPPGEGEVMRFPHANMSRQIQTAAIAVQGQMDAITRSALPTGVANLPNAKDLDVDLLLRGGSPQGVPLPVEGSCDGRRIFVYDLPEKFNVDLVGQCDTLVRWFNFCDYFVKEGMGANVPTDELNDRGEKVLVPADSWFLTHQYALELIFKARLKHYSCLTTNASQAELFFVPYYAGLDVIRWHFKANSTNEQRDKLTFELMDWLEGQESWSRNSGIDHVFVLGKIGWDFRRSSPTAHWGSQLLTLPQMYKATKLLIERDPWHLNDIGVPHPTFFHPKDDNEIRTWLSHVEQSERRYLVSFAGMPRPNMKTNVRGHLIQQCLDHPDDCFLLRCVKSLCMRPDSTMNLFLHSHFCMQPPGDSPTRRSVFDSLVGGCIPVLFDPYTAYYQYPWHLPHNASSYSVFIPSADVMSGQSNIVNILKGISPEERMAMRKTIIRQVIPGLLYSQPGTKHSDFRDAFDISIQALLHRVANLRAGKAST